MILSGASELVEAIDEVGGEIDPPTPHFRSFDPVHGGAFSRRKS